MHRGKENETASLTGITSSSYVARLHKRQELDKVRQSTSARSVSDRLMRKSTSLRPKSGLTNSVTSQGMGRPVGPAGSSIAIDAQLDDATAKVQSELDRCDRKLELLKNHMAHPPASSKTSAQRDVAAKPADVGEPTAVRRVITATGQGCKDVLAAGTSAPPPRGALWKTRAHKTARTESSCMLQLREGRYRDVTLRITFSEAATVPARLCLEHAPTPTAAFAPLGVVPLQAKSMKQLKHVFRLGPDTIVQKCLRISCLGHIAKDHSCVHSVSYLLITGEPAPVIEHKMAPSSVVSTASAAGAPAEMETASSGPPRILVQVPDVGGQLKEAASLPASRPGSAKGKKGERIQLKKAAPPPPPLPGAAKKAAPPPPPPLAGMGKPAAKAAAAAPGGPAPSRPTLRLFWDKLQPRASTLNGTVWGQLANGQASLDFAELEEEFAAKQPAVDLTAKGAKRQAAPPSGPRIITLQRTNNVGALLARLKLSPQQAKQALLHLLGDDDDAMEGEPVRELEEDDIESLLQCLPTEDEQERLASFSGPTEGLVPAEAFMLGVLPIPALRDRLQAIIFLHGFHSRTTAASNAARLVTAACTEVRDSALLRSILKTALAIGNFLNAGNRNGSAVGFQVDSLLKLKDVRSTRARSRTLLHFLAREVARKHPNGASLAAELPSCRAAARVSLSDLRAELDALADGIEAAHRAGRAGGADPASMDELLTAATERLAGVNGLVVEADASFLELRSFFNGKESTMDDPAAFFALMTTFSQQLDAAHSDNAAADARAGKQSTRPSSAPAQRRKTSPEPGKVEGGAPSPPLAAATVAEPEVTPPMKRQEKVLATIRLYSRMSNDQRRALLTDEGTKERLKGLDLTHRHSLAVPTLRQVAAAPSPAPPGGAPATRRGALLASAPAVSIADLMAKTAAAAEGNCKGSLAEEGGKVQQLEAVVEEQESPPAHAELEPEPEPSPGASKETHQQEEHANAAVQSQSVAVPPVAGLSSPVVRALRASRSLMESVHLRGSIDAASPASDAPQGEASLAASPEPSHGSTERQSEDDLCSSGVSLSRGALPMQEAPTPVLLRAQRGQVHSPAGEETQQARRNEAPLPLNQSYEQRMPAMGSPVNVARSAEDSPSPAVLRASGSSALFREKTPAVSLLAAPRQLDCSVELQPVPGARVWESTTTGLELADGEGLDDDAWEVASVATSDANPMRSAPDSPRYDLGQGQYSSERSTARDGASSREEGPAEWDSHDVSTSPEEQQRQLEEAMEAAARRSVGILRNSSEWAGQVAKLGGGLRSSKRVSFSLPNSPRDVVVDEGVAPQADTAGEGRPEGQERSQPDVSGLDLSLAMKLMANAAQVRRSWQGGEAAAGPEPSVQGVETEAHGAGEGGITQEYDEGVESQGAGEEDIAQGDEEREDVRASIEGQAAAVLRAALAAEMRRSLPGLPGVPADALPGLPLGLSPLNIDAFMAAVIANAGNTPTGPLARGVRQGDQHLFDDAAAEALREAARARSRADPNPHQRKALLEPIVPAPLGMGVRASETVAQGISPSTLRHSLEAHLAASILPARTATVAATRDLEMDAEGDATEQYDGEHYLDEEDVDQQYPGESSYGLEGEEAWGQRDEEPAEEGGSDGEEGEVDDDAMAGEAWAPVHEDRRLSRKVHSSLANERLSMWQSYSGRSR